MSALTRVHLMVTKKQRLKAGYVLISVLFNSDTARIDEWPELKKEQT